jgi:hypothetical protein
VSVYQRKFDSFAAQCNYGLQLVKTEWVLSIDSDYKVIDEFLAEIRSLNLSSDVEAYQAGFLFNIHGCSLRASLYPPRIVLYRRSKASYVDEGHSHRVQIAGKVGRLKAKIIHDDRKPLSHWLSSQIKYSLKEAAYLASAPKDELNTADRLRQCILLMPFLVPIYTLFYKRVFLDGLPGLFYVFQRTVAEVLIALCYLDRKLLSRANLNTTLAHERTPATPAINDP